MKQISIIGIDPGTTTGWAILDLDGNILQIGSSKDVGLSNLISITSSFGKPLIVGCDKKKIPGFVYDFSRKCGSRVINPREDLQVDTKRQICHGRPHENCHEMDALASAIYAHKQISPLLDRIKSVKNKQNIALPTSEIFEIVINNEISIKDAIEALSEPSLEENIPNLNGPQPSKSTITKIRPASVLLSLLRSRQKEAEIVKTHAQKLQGKIGEQQNKIKKLENQLLDRGSKSKKSAESLHKDQKIQFLTQQLSKQQSESSKMRNLLINIEKALLSGEEQIVAQVLPDLTKTNYERHISKNNITSNTTLYIQEPNRFSSQVIQSLQSVQPLLISDKKPHSRSLPIICVRHLKRTMIDSAAIFRAEEIRREARDARILQHIITDYKRERKKELIE